MNLYRQTSSTRVRPLGWQSDRLIIMVYLLIYLFPLSISPMVIEVNIAVMYNTLTQVSNENIENIEKEGWVPQG